MRRSLFAVAAALACFTSLAAAQTLPPVEAYGALPQIADAAISPDGSKLALALNVEGTPLVAVVDAETLQRSFAARVDDQQLRGVGWADDTHATFIVSKAVPPTIALPPGYRYRGSPTVVEFWRPGVVDLATERMRLLTVSRDETWMDNGSELIAPIEGDPGYGRLIGRIPGTDRLGLFRVSLDNGRVDAAAGSRGGQPVDFVLDARGDIVARVDSNERSNVWSVYAYGAGEPRLIMQDQSETGQPPYVAGLLADGRLAVLTSGGERRALYAVSRADGASEMLVDAGDGDVSNAIVDPWTREVIGADWGGEHRGQRFFVPALTEIAARLDQLVPGGARIVSWSRNYQRVLFYAENGLDGGAYYLFDAATNNLRRIAYLYPQVAQAQQGVRQSITYRARDGTRIPAFLTLPEGERTNMPLVLLVHGGPSSHDTMDFDFWSAFLASRGYAVLQPNFRGSDGYGDEWERAGYGQWGRLMQTDVEDGVAALERAGMIDPERVCIVGASYGGYAALAGVTLTPERYTCGVSVAGVSDLTLMLRRGEARTGAESMSSDYWRMSIGDYEEESEAIRAVSPALLADRVQVPVLLIHGTDDTVVPILQSRRMRDRLESAGKDVRYVELRGDDHWLSDAETRIQMLREIETFLAQHLAAN